MIRKLLSKLSQILTQKETYIIFTHDELNQLKQGRASKEVYGKSKKVVGKVKFFNVQKGFGFIANIDSGIESFLHASNIADYSDESAPLEGDLLEYNEMTSPKGTQAKYAVQL